MKKDFKKLAPKVGDLKPPLKVYLFTFFNSSLKKFKEIPPKEVVGELVAKEYPSLVFSSKLDKHYSYYKSRFLERYKV